MMNGMCSSDSAALRSVEEFAYKSVRMYHASNDWKESQVNIHDPNSDGLKDYCRFYTNRNCDISGAYTDCQGHCNLKNIFPRIKLFQCWWNTAYYPS